MPSTRHQGGTADITGRVVVPRVNVSSAIVDLGQNGVEILEAVIKGSKERPAVVIPQESLFSTPQGAA